MGKFGVNPNVFSRNQVVRLLSTCARLSKPNFGQPSHETHPHLLCVDDVTPRISKSELRSRRDRLATLVRAHGKTSRPLYLPY